MPDASSWRCFVAVALGEELRASLAAAADRWRAHPNTSGLRWTDPDGWHLTLAFLGDTDPGRVPALLAALNRATGGAASAAYPTGGLGAFPSSGRARVLWYGMEDPERHLRRLAAAVRRELGLPPDDRFRAHVTLARARHDPVDLRPFLESAAAPEGVLDVTAIHLMRSHLGRGPARYESLAAIRLGGSPP